MSDTKLAIVLIKFRVFGQDEPRYLLMRNHRWGDLSFVVGTLTKEDTVEWAKRARSKCDEVLAPLKYGKDFLLLPIFSQPLNLELLAAAKTTAQVFTLVFETDSIECLRRLPKEGMFRIVKESDITRGDIANLDSLEAQVLRATNGTDFSWGSTVSADVGDALFSGSCPGPIHFGDQGIEVCNTCGDCICCAFAHIDHTKAEYECFTDDEGLCHLKAHANRACVKC